MNKKKGKSVTFLKNNKCKFNVCYNVFFSKVLGCCLSDSTELSFGLNGTILDYSKNIEFQQL